MNLKKQKLGEHVAYPSRMALQFLLVFCCLVVFALGQHESNWNQEARDHILNIHNSLRRDVGGCKMNKLVYDLDLEMEARTWTEKCNFYETYSDNFYGLNYNHIDYEVNDDLKSETERIQWAAKGWFDTKNNFTHGSFMCHPHCRYTQMVWGETQNIGCWSTHCSNVSVPWMRNMAERIWFINCFYTPPALDVWKSSENKPYGKKCEQPCFGPKQTEEDKLCVGEMVLCTPEHISCQGWAERGECEKNPKWMLVNCKKACKQCG